MAEDERGSKLATNCNREMNWRVVEDEGRERGLLSIMIVIVLNTISRLWSVNLYLVCE